MSVEFRENMDGRLVFDGENFDRLVSFGITAVGSRAREMLRVAELSIQGTVHVDGLADDAPARGRLIVSPFTERRIRYTLDFPGVGGDPLRLTGLKCIRWLHPIRSWTSMTVELSRPDGDLVARGQMWFRLRDLASFLRGFGTGTTTGEAEVISWPA